MLSKSDQGAGRWYPRSNMRSMDGIIRTWALRTVRKDIRIFSGRYRNYHVILR
ncbi:MAG: hypothetical protein JW736_06470 [Deltaproteobacteria bacterium]|nr:hypothetical protein [Deltaproteobacteria bacterium]